MTINYFLILKILGILAAGILGAFLFNIFLMPQMLTNPYFERFQFVKDYKQGKIVVNTTERVYIQDSLAIENAISRVQNSVVAITEKTAEKVISSGLVSTSDGNIITLANLVNSNSQLFISGELTSFMIVKKDVKNNLALLKVNKNNLQTVAFADFNKLKVGQKVFWLALFSPKQNDLLVNEGIIRQIEKDNAGQLVRLKTSIIEKSAVNGGSLFNLAGEFIGLSFIDSEGKVSAVPVNKVQTILGL